MTWDQLQATWGLVLDPNYTTSGSSSSGRPKLTYNCLLCPSVLTRFFPKTTTFFFQITQGHAKDSRIHIDVPQDKINSCEIEKVTVTYIGGSSWHIYSEIVTSLIHDLNEVADTLPEVVAGRKRMWSITDIQTLIRGELGHYILTE